MPRGMHDLNRDTLAARGLLPPFEERRDARFLDDDRDIAGTTPQEGADLLEKPRFRLRVESNFLLQA
jgi:hypothetical protein